MWARRSHIEVQLRAEEGTEHETVSRVGPCVQQELLEHWIRVGTIRKQGEMRMYAHDGKIAIDPEFWNASCQGVVNSFRHITSSAWVAGWPKFGIDNNSSSGRTFHECTQVCGCCYIMVGSSRCVTDSILCLLFFSVHWFWWVVLMATNWPCSGGKS